MRDMYNYTRNIVLNIIAHPFNAVITFLFMLLFLIIISSCRSTHEPFHFVKVLGITHAGDTVLIDVNSLRPKIYNTYQYNNSIPYYNTIPYNPQIIIRPIVVPKPRPTIVTPIGIKPIVINPPIKPTKNKD
tara:strand:- start:335 stop:727 length:393 start_codon:yes stop_codon:yes gene_type:complete